MKVDVNQLFERIVKYEDREAYNLFFDYYYPRLIRFSLLFVKYHTYAEEIVSEVLVKIFKNRKKLAKMDHLRGYIFIVVKNESLKFLAKVNKQNSIIQSIGEDEEDFIIQSNETPEEIYLEHELNDVITDAIKNLPPKRKMVFQLVKEEGLRYKDVAEALGISIKTVEIHMGLATKGIADALKAYQKGNYKSVRIRKIDR